MSSDTITTLPEPPGPETEADFAPEDLAIGAESPLALMIRLQARYGDILRAPSPRGYTYLYNHPEYVQHFLHSTNYERTTLIKIALGESSLSTDGQIWKQQRRVISPAFQPARVRAFAELMADEAGALADRWLAEGVQQIDADEEMMRLTLMIVMRAMFSVDVSEEVERVSWALTEVIRDLGAFTGALLSVPVTVDPGRNRRIREAIATLDDVVFRIIEGRRKDPGARGDLLDMLLTAEDPDTGARLDDKALRDEAVTMLAAGHETTATSLTWAWHLLSQHPEVEARFHAEVDALGRRPQLEDLERLRFTESVLQETLRLYPPVWMFARQAKQDEALGGYQIRGGSPAFICPYMLHRHPDFWDAPEAFDPDRFFDPERSTKMERYAYIPFGRGPHMCAGHQFATQEGVLILSILGQRFRMRPARDAAPALWPLITLRVKDGLPMRLERRG